MHTTIRRDNNPKSLILGLDKAGTYISQEGNSPTLLLAPAGAGKGVAFVIPNLLMWDESVIVFDINGENYNLTSGWRNSVGQKIYKFNPMSMASSHCYNPLDYISEDKDLMIGDIQKIGSLLLDKKTCKSCKVGKYSQAKDLFIALVLYLKASKEKIVSIGQIYKMLVNNLTKEFLDNVKTANIHPYGGAIINNFLSKSDKERNKSIAILMSALHIWSNPLVDKATATSDFDIRKFRTEKSSLYICADLPDAISLKPLLNFMYQHMMQQLMKSRPERNTYNILFIFDEITMLGNLKFLTDVIAYCRGYNLALLMIVQDINQLRAVYGKKGSKLILSGSAIKIAFSAVDIETAELIADLCIEEVDESKIIGGALTKNAAITLAHEKQIMIKGGQYLISKKLVYYNRTDLQEKVIAPVEIKK